jgi:uncharacterized protein (DUF488 family)
MKLFTIGHSNHPIERFLELLGAHGIDAVADVRSVPASARHPQYNRATLAKALAACGIEYLFLGAELGARRSEPEVYVGEIASYERIARLRAFCDGLEKVKARVAANRVALMCAEKDPLQCHRALLVCRHLRNSMAGGICHILADGSIESHVELEGRLVASLSTKRGERNANETQPELFAEQPNLLVREPESPLDHAYRLRGLAIAYKIPTPIVGGGVG